MSDLTRPASNPLLTICEVHRQIYKKVRSGGSKEEIIDLLEQAYTMGKKMDAKLRQYKFDYDDEWWDENKKYEELKD